MARERLDPEKQQRVEGGRYSAVAFSQARGQVRIAVGPNVLVTRAGDISHVESAVAANPGEQRRLVATAITFTLPQGGYADKTYATFD